MSELDDDLVSWFGPPLAARDQHADEDVQEFSRLWRGFMTARVTLGLVLLLLQGTFFILGHAHNEVLIILCATYFVASVLVRFLVEPRSLGRHLDPRWLAIVGVDVLTFAGLQVLQGTSINYAPLLAMPVLLASVLGSLSLSLGTAASVTLLLLLNGVWHSLQSKLDPSNLFAQAALTGVGCFVIAFLANQIAARLTLEKKRVRSSQIAERTQRHVNELVIESLTDGILVVDAMGLVKAINPAARTMLGLGRAAPDNGLQLASQAGWAPLMRLAQRSLALGESVQVEVAVHHSGQGERRLFARTRLAMRGDANSKSLCVLFLQDQREVEARVRTEKLAGMGRMSAAVAHEIRNPLAAIAQANALLEEDISDPRQRQLTTMVSQNTKRLEKIVDDVLNLSRVQRSSNELPLELALNTTVQRVCLDWARQTGDSGALTLVLSSHVQAAQFDAEHLRRVLVNLLDNAKRYATGKSESIHVSTRTLGDSEVILSVWSDGAPLEPSVERHLFEPFFSSESRSSGLGLYICRELCEGHGASITYQRGRRNVGGSNLPGNEFNVTLQSQVLQPTQPGTQAPLPFAFAQSQPVA